MKWINGLVLALICASAQVSWAYPEPDNRSPSTIICWSSLDVTCIVCDTNNLCSKSFRAPDSICDLRDVDVDCTFVKGRGH